MHCPTCQHENREEAKFCEACGSNLTLACLSCGAQARPGAAFCDTCGVALAKGEKAKRGKGETRRKKPSDPRHQTPDARPSIGERRQLTVMFCDLVGSTSLSASMDPEEWQTVVRNYQHVCGEVIRRFDGHVAQYLGDGILVYFGYPVAHEDDAQRAVRAGLDIIASLKSLAPSPFQGEGSTSSASAGEGSKNDQLPNAPHPSPLPQRARELQVRIGIHTGLVIISEIGEGERREQLALGETPNLAARLQSVAEPDTVVVSGAAYWLIEGLFACQDLGPLELKGVATPMHAYRILRESEARSRLEVAALRGLTPLVGREEEVSLLFKRWEQATAGTGQVVLLNGEAGIGKSRLVQVLKDHVSHNNHPRVEWRCSPYHQNSALYPVIEQLQRLLQFERDDSAEEKFRKLEGGARHAAPLQADAIPLLASLLSLPCPNHYPPLTLTPQRQKQKTLEALLAWLLHEAQQQPVLVIVEDLHWVDPSTLELLSLLIDQVPSSRVLVIATFRPDFTPPWPMAAHLTHLTLSRFARRQVEAMVEKVTSGRSLSTEIIKQIVEKTDGVPLFVEELTKTIVESVGAQHAAPLQLAIPATLQDSLMARLDRLNTAKEIAQLGATIGREFTYELLHAVAPVDEKNLQSALTKLVEAELLYQRGQPPTAHYTFKHALVQDAAYQSLLKSTRQYYHQRIARALEEEFLEIKETQPERLAQHYTEAGQIEQAIPYWQAAGQKAVERAANAEAVSHLTQGLELLQSLPDTVGRAQRELTLQLALGHPLMATKGEGAREVESVYTRAIELCRQVGETLQLFPSMAGLWLVRTVRGELQAARGLAEQLLRFAQNAQDPALLLSAHLNSGISLFYLGELAAAHTHVEQALVLYDPQQYRSQAFRAGLDPGVWCLCYKPWILWFLGYPDQALNQSNEALTLARDISRPYDVAVALWFAVSLYQLRREAQLTQEHAEAQIIFSTEQGFPLWVAHGMKIRGWVLAEQGQVEEGSAQIQQGEAADRTMGTAAGRTYFFALLAEAYGKKRQVVEGLKVLAEALAHVGKTDERYYEAELYRLKGELLLLKAEQMKQEAIDREP